MKWRNEMNRMNGKGKKAKEKKKQNVKQNLKLNFKRHVLFCK